jgi:DNA-binding response OmpR family regulator
MMRFEQCDMIPFHATTGREAIHLSQQVAPDLLVLDIILPEEDGFTVVEWLQKHDHLYNTPLLVYSAKDLSESERNRLKLGDTEFLTKGRATLQEFEQCVMALLHKSTNYEVVETNHDSSTDSSGR